MVELLCTRRPLALDVFGKRGLHTLCIFGVDHVKVIRPRRGIGIRAVAQQLAQAGRIKRRARHAVPVHNAGLGGTHHQRDAPLLGGQRLLHLMALGHVGAGGHHPQRLAARIGHHRAGLGITPSIGGDIQRHRRAVHAPAQRLGVQPLDLGRLFGLAQFACRVPHDLLAPQRVILLPGAVGKHVAARHVAHRQRHRYRVHQVVDEAHTVFKLAGLRGNLVVRRAQRLFLRAAFGDVDDEGNPAQHKTIGITHRHAANLAPHIRTIGAQQPVLFGGIKLTHRAFRPLALDEGHPAPDDARPVVGVNHHLEIVWPVSRVCVGCIAAYFAKARRVVGFVRGTVPVNNAHA